MPDFRLELDKLLGDLIIGTLGQDAQDCPSSLIQIDASTEGTPAGTAALVCDVP